MSEKKSGGGNRPKRGDRAGRLRKEEHGIRKPSGGAPDIRQQAPREDPLGGREKKGGNKGD
jgi:hypothetical protein